MIENPLSIYTYIPVSTQDDTQMPQHGRLQPPSHGATSRVNPLFYISSVDPT